MEYMPLGDLEQNVQEIEKSLTHSRSPLSEGEIQEITRQILEGLKIMHTEGFAHRDLKPQNVLVVQKHPQWWVKLGDFGLSKKQTDGTAYRTRAGTQEYMAPELFYYVQEIDTETSEYTNAIDLWSLGCIVYRVVTGEVPFPSMLSLRNYCIDQAKAPLNMPPQMEEAAKFVQGLLMPDPANRPVASAALKSAWLATSKHHFQHEKSFEGYFLIPLCRGQTHNHAE
jgi:serine/threonine protein kinase